MGDIFVQSIRWRTRLLSRRGLWETNQATNRKNIGMTRFPPSGPSTGGAA
jgi:hypothetical protein